MTGAKQWKRVHVCQAYFFFTSMLNSRPQVSTIVINNHHLYLLLPYIVFTQAYHGVDATTVRRVKGWRCFWVDNHTMLIEEPGAHSKDHRCFKSSHSLVGQYQWKLSRRFLMANGLQWLRSFDPLAGSVLFFKMRSKSDHSLGYTRSVPRPSLIRFV